MMQTRSFIGIAVTSRGAVVTSAELASGPCNVGGNSRRNRFNKSANGSCSPLVLRRRLNLGLGRRDRSRPQTAVSDMHAHAVFALLFCILFPRVTRPAPSVGPSPALRDALERGRMLADKISKDVPTALAQASTLDFLPPTADLQMMATALHIPPAPVLKPLSPNFNVDTCMSRMAAGVRMFQGLLGVLSERLGGLDSLQADLRDLLAHVDKAREVAGPGGGNASLDEDPDQWAGLAARLQGDYETQAAAHLTLTQLRSFMHDVIRSLRAITAYRTLAR